MNVGQLVKLDLITLFKGFFIYLALIISILPALAIAFSIKVLKGPFEVLHVTSFYSLFAAILSVVIAMIFFTKDISSGTRSLMLNTSKNRMKYLLSKFIEFIFIGFIFGIVGAVTLYFVSVYLGENYELILYSKVILNYTLFVTLYSTLFFSISLKYKNISTLYALALLSISFFPNIVDTLIASKSIPKFISDSVDFIPVYFLPALIGSHNFEFFQYIITFITLFILLAISYSIILKEDI